MAAWPQAEEEEHRRGRDQIRHAQLSAEDAMRKARASEGDLQLAKKN